jgi:hypothetical protein
LHRVEQRPHPGHVTRFGQLDELTLLLVIQPHAFGLPGSTPTAYRKSAIIELY